MKYLITFLLITSSFFGYTQNADLNQYKYIVVENQYEFQNEANEYRLNELAVFELKKRNFTVFRNSEVLPEDINRGACNALQLKMDESGSLSRFLTLRLVDCSGKTVFTTIKGKGTTKSNDKAYFEALRDAMTSFDEVNYEYNGQIKNELENGENLSLNYTKIEETAPNFNKKVNDTSTGNSTPESEVVELSNDQIYRTKSKEYFILSTATGFDIYKNKGLIGTLKKSKGGCYFVKTIDFIGVAYETSKGISIEYTYFGKDEILEFIK